MSKLVLLLISLLHVGVASTYAQSITQPTFTTAGRLLSNQGLQLNFTLGELSIKNLKGGGVEMTTGLFGEQEEDAIALPVTLVDFRLAAASSAVKLYWTVTQEDNASHYELLKSTDGVNFLVIGKVMALGTVISQHQYDFTDVAFTTKSFYRLKMVDRDSRFKLSNILFISPETSTAAISVYPNPIRSFVTVTINVTEANTAAINVYSAAGTALITKSHMLAKGQNILSINTASLPAGAYFINIKTNDLQVTRQVNKTY